DADRADLVFRDLRDRVLCGDGELVRALAPAPVVGDEDGGGATGADDRRLDGAGAATTLHSDPVSLDNPEFVRDTGVQLTLRLRRVIDEGPDAPSLIAREEMTHHAARREDDRVVGVDVLRGRLVGGDQEAGSAVGEIEGAVSLRDGVPGARLEETHSPLGCR